MSLEISPISRFEGCLIGCAVGDALGIPLEYFTDKNLKRNPLLKDKNYEKIMEFKNFVQEKYGGRVTEMIKSPLRPFEKGEYSDDTAQTLDLADSLTEFGLDPEDFAKRLVRWYDDLGGKGCGRTTKQVIEQLKEGKPWWEAGANVYKNGSPPANGSIMRTSPIGLYFSNPDQIDKAAANISRVTHPHPEAIVSCQIASQLINQLKQGVQKLEAIDFLRFRFTDLYDRVMEEDTSIHAGGAVVTLKIALSTFIETDNFKDAVVEAVNREGDTDSYGAVTGAFAGTYYGIESIPHSWKKALNPLNSDQIAQKARELHFASPSH